MKHVLIGGNGFLGREVVRQLVARGGQDIVVVDLPSSYGRFPEVAQPGVSHVRADISVPGALDAIALNPEDVVHHLATQLITPNKPRFGRDAYFRVCAVDGTRELLAWMKRQKNRHLVFWSTDMVYGPAVVIPRPENHPKQPFGPYGRSKVAAEEIVAAAVAAGDVTSTIFRPRLILGPGRLGILEVLFKMIDKGRPVPLIGQGTNRFQFVSVADCARATIRAADLGCPNGAYNLGSENSPTVYELMTEFIARTGSKSRIVRTPGWLVKGVLRFLHLFKLAPMDPEQFEIADLEVSLDISAAKRDLGWVPQHADTDLLTAAYRAYRGEDARLP
ncbi:MAG: NAD(P)-dependent oxidoreductase [Rhodobacteraceae bacterium]|nr:NAD(P)-dependent oxidoreductase [Paracoccaceae bacterium]